MMTQGTRSYPFYSKLLRAISQKTTHNTTPLFCDIILILLIYDKNCDIQLINKTNFQF